MSERMQEGVRWGAGPLRGLHMHRTGADGAHGTPACDTTVAVKGVRQRWTYMPRAAPLLAENPGWAACKRMGGSGCWRTGPLSLAMSRPNTVPMPGNPYMTLYITLRDLGLPMLLLQGIKGMFWYPQ